MDAGDHPSLNAGRGGDGPLVHIEQANRVLRCLEEGLSEECGMNPEILRAAVQASIALTHLAAQAIERQERSLARW
ncbi:hypothetical protein [Sphingomonas qomolangmaensis]|uniref:Uncharacterized protein n=1 Tax=Sphingomonas qomolangmaensis TaxID=2918765 RepID=A0ABY5L8E9_9SPHN|nr:hypothetical protein [Sphingomonas qomolangmaensis]UUL82226.1 hypothetical protein NMP03_13720 [Sphingomonas qomolangmaensis]